MTSRLSRFVKYVFDLFMKYALKFGVIGLIGYFVDFGIFNLLRVGTLGDDHFFQGPIGAKIVSVTISTLITWFGNRFWTFREHRRENFLLELLEFGAIAVAGLGISLAFLYVSHYVLGFQTLLADNISANVIGLFFATAFRFLLYRFWVYGDHRRDSLSVRTRRAQEDAEAAAKAEQI